MERTKYIAPEIELIELDSQISLALQSALDEPPVGPWETRTTAPEHFNNSVINTDLA